jgi:hypothetical protein
MHTGETLTLIKSAWNFTKRMHSTLECIEHHRLLDVDWSIFDKNFKTAIWKQCPASMRSGGNSDGRVNTKYCNSFGELTSEVPLQKLMAHVNYYYCYKQSDDLLRPWLLPC